MSIRKQQNTLITRQLFIIALLERGKGLVDAMSVFVVNGPLLEAAVIN